MSGTSAGGLVPDPTGIIQTAPGEEAQVDYGEGPIVRAPATGKYRRTRLFVLSLGFPRGIRAPAHLALEQSTLG